MGLAWSQAGRADQVGHQKDQEDSSALPTERHRVSIKSIVKGEFPTSLPPVASDEITNYLLKSSGFTTWDTVPAFWLSPESK